MSAAAPSGRWERYIGFWPAITLLVLVVLAALLILPVANIVALSFTGAGTADSHWANYRTFFSERFYYQTLINSFWVSIAATSFAVLLGVPAAYFVNRYAIWGRDFVRTAVVLVFVSPPFIGSYSWVILFGRSGLITGWLADLGLSLPSIYGASGIVLVFTLQFFPFVFLMVSSGLRSIDQSIEDAARNLGSSELRSFFTVLCPILAPSISAGALLVFVAAFTDFGTPVIIGEKFRVLPVLIFGEFVNEVGGRPVLASMLAVLLLSVTTAALLLQRWFAARHAHAAAAVRPLEITEQSVAKRLLATAFVWGLLGLALLPILNIVISSFLKANGPVLIGELTLDNYRRIGNTLATPLWNTLRFTAAATLLCAAIGTAVGYIIVRRAGKLGALIDITVMFSYAVPGIVLGVALVVTYNQPPFLLTGTAAILILAYFIRRLPFSVRSAVGMLQQLSRDTEDASINLGASPARTFVKVTIPLLSTAILSGMLLTWSNTIRELSATLILQSGGTVTMSIEIYNEVVNGNFGLASALGSILILLTFLPLVVLFRVLGRREEALV